MEQEWNALFQALADPTRRHILRLLNEGDKSAGELASHFNMSAPSVSHHLSVLRNAELVISKRQGQAIIYAINTTVAQEALQWMMDLVQVGKTKKNDNSEGEN